MPFFEIECLEKFLVKTTYHVVAKNKKAAEKKVRSGKVSYDSHSIEEGDDEFVQVLSNEECDEDDYNGGWEGGEEEK